MRQFLNVLIFVFFTLCQNTFLYAASEPYKRLSSQSPYEGYQVNYFFSFSCKVCKKWAPLYEKQLSELDDSIKVNYLPLARTRAENILSKAFLMTKKYNIDNSSQKYFDFYQNSYFVREKDVKELVLTILETEEIEANPWTERNLAFLERKLEKSKETFSDYGLSAVPLVLVFSPSGIYLFTPNKKLPAQHLIDQVRAFIEKDKAS